ncbi:unnamed protein product [Darwinula stevensoni]|uniref:glutaminyl-peptide cyclotransferase n=1 Tax=Darwinula stevensoni TaxID=69355 RepID=A0A7R9A6A6_9CRUS|nr:unnamed protein product [Darwinula stevensoni]CAG0893904.1 unnamed protein product [Darwinula stevensoni]
MEREVSALLFCLLLLPPLSSLCGLSQQRERIRDAKERELTDAELEAIVDLNDIDRFDEYLQPMLVRRVSGSAAHAAVRQHIIDSLESLGWTVETDDFVDAIPEVDDEMQGTLNFSNVIGTWNRDGGRNLVLGCHYESKYFSATSGFMGATDSAVSCAILIDIAASLTPFLQEQQIETGLQLMFFDGEEAFLRWSSEDSLYGSRHLAQLWQDTPHPLNDSCTMLDSIVRRRHFHAIPPHLVFRGEKKLDEAGIQRGIFVPQELLVVLDLFGTELGCSGCTRVLNFFEITSETYQEISTVESRLEFLGLLEPHQNDRTYFHPDPMFAEGFLEDDHIPFWERGVKVIHGMPFPYPPVWHKETDNADAIHWVTVENLLRILRGFTAQYLGIQPLSSPESSPPLFK